LFIIAIPMQVNITSYESEIADVGLRFPQIETEDYQGLYNILYA
jgi:hypothetical protein